MSSQFPYNHLHHTFSLSEKSNINLAVGSKIEVQKWCKIDTEQVGTFEVKGKSTLDATLLTVPSVKYQIDTHQVFPPQKAPPSPSHWISCCLSSHSHVYGPNIKCATML